jgi:hypothetical protein
MAGRVEWLTEADDTNGHINRYLLLLAILIIKTEDKSLCMPGIQKKYDSYENKVRSKIFDVCLNSGDDKNIFFNNDICRKIVYDIRNGTLVRFTKDEKTRIYAAFSKNMNVSRDVEQLVCRCLTWFCGLFLLLLLIISVGKNVLFGDSLFIQLLSAAAGGFGFGLFYQLLNSGKIKSVPLRLLFIVRTSECMIELHEESHILFSAADIKRTDGRFKEVNYGSFSREALISSFYEKFDVPSDFLIRLQNNQFAGITPLNQNFEINQNILPVVYTYLCDKKKTLRTDNKLLCELFHLQDKENLSRFKREYKTAKLTGFKKYVEQY